MNKKTVASGLFATGFYGCIGWALAYALTGLFGHPWLIGPCIGLIALSFIGASLIDNENPNALSAEDLE